MYLGVDVLKSLVLTTGVFSQFDSETVDARTIKKVWDHSTEVGSLAKLIATSQSDQSLVSDYALMGGLLTDIGKLVFATNFPEKFTEIASKMAAESRRDFDVEEEIIGQSHSDVGAYLVGLWGLPNPVVECVAYHHAPLACTASGFTAVTAVHVADAIVCADGDAELPQLDKDYLEQLGLTADIPGWIQLHVESRAEGAGA